MRNKKINKKRGGWKKRLSKIFRKTLNKKTGGKNNNTRKIKQTNQKGGLKENFGMSHGYFVSQGKFKIFCGDLE